MHPTRFLPARRLALIVLLLSTSEHPASDRRTRLNFAEHRTSYCRIVNVP